MAEQKTIYLNWTEDIQEAITLKAIIREAGLPENTKQVNGKLIIQTAMDAVGNVVYQQPDEPVKE